jgi:linoleoyl-CoA desaturase
MTIVVRFTPRSDFHRTLRDRVDALFPSDGAKKGGWAWRTKVGTALGLFFFGYAGLMLSTSWWFVPLFGLSVYASWVLLAFNVMHDGAHEAASKSIWSNRLAGTAMEFLGGSQWLWKQKHNQMHHTYTNVIDKDDDLDVGKLMRLSVHQPWLPIHRFQWLYAWLAYAVLSLYMMVTDFQKYFHRRIGQTQLPAMKAKDHAMFWGGKAFYLTYALVLPTLAHGFWPTLFVFLVLHAAFGLTMAVVFQVAHVVEDAQTFQPAAVMEHDWATHQVHTTVDFAPHNKWLSWWVGGLNFQVEHHLFHHISHVHYAKLQPVIRQTCEEFGVPYRCFPRFRDAVLSHAKQLYVLGRPRFS